MLATQVHQALEVGGNLGGICQAAVHYFQVNEQRGDITFENTTLPGSQSSNMLIDVVLSLCLHTQFIISSGRTF